MEFNKEFIADNPFYIFGGIVITFIEVEKYIKKMNQKMKNFNILLTILIV